MYLLIMLYVITFTGSLEKVILKAVSISKVYNVSNEEFH